MEGTTLLSATACFGGDESLLLWSEGHWKTLLGFINIVKIQDRNPPGLHTLKDNIGQNAKKTAGEALAGGEHSRLLRSKNLVTSRPVSVLA